MTPRLRYAVEMNRLLGKLDPERYAEPHQARTGARPADGQNRSLTLGCTPIRGATSRAVCQVHALAYNLGNFLRTLAMPKTADPWSLTSLREKLVKIGTKVVSHGRYVTFQIAEVAVSRQMFADNLMLIARLPAPPAPA